jgi:hypothetical protein
MRPEPVVGLNAVVSIAAGLSHSLALKSDGSVWSWGENDFWQSDNGLGASRHTPAPVPGLDNAVAISAGGNFSLALSADGTVWAWGRNEYGQLGDGTPFTLTNHVRYTNIVTTTNYTVVTNYTVRTNYSSVTRNVRMTNAVPITTWLHHHYLDVVDYAVPSEPLVRDPVNIPGSLQGVSHNGALLYTVGQRAETAGGSDWIEWLDASAYDGIEAHLVDSLALPRQWPHPTLLRNATVFLGRPAPDTNSAPRLEAWTLPDTGRFTQTGSVRLETPAQNLVAFGDLLAVQAAGKIDLFNVSNPSQLTPIGSKRFSSCLGFELKEGDGTVDRGLWLPLGFYGVEKVSPSLNPR